MSTIPRLVISAPSSGHGKTAVSVGLLAALSARGYRAAGFKIGPDHVDAAYLGLAAGRPGRNLDPRMVGAKRMGPLFAHGAASLDIAVVEGTMGLFDGLAGRTDSESTAQISGLLRAPVILVVDVGAMGQSVAALVHGFRAYDELLWLGGVILNRVASTRHEQLLREALDDIGVPVLGALRRHALTDVGDAGAPLPSRHHGVAPVVHHNIDAVRAVRRLGEVIAGAVDIDRTMALARSAPRLTADAWNPESEVALAGVSDAAISPLAATRIGRRPVIGVAFAYPETAELLRAAGADVVPFDPLRDEMLPDGVDGLVIGAALPESYAEELTFNSRLRAAVASHAAAGKPIAAEGTGLVWLCRDYNGRAMCGVVDASARETDLVVLGYREATARSSSVLLPVGTQVVGHKMHRTTVTPRAGLQAAWTWAGGPAEGFVQRSVHASYLGLHWAGTPGIASRFVAAASATAAPAPGQWTTPTANPYGRPPSAVSTAQVGSPHIPAGTIPTAQVPTPAYAPVSAAPLAAAPLPVAGVEGGPARPVRGLPSTLQLPGDVAAPGDAPADPPTVAVSSSAPAVSPVSNGPSTSAGSSVSSVPAGPAVPAAASSLPPNAPTSPGASSPFGPALGPSVPTPWTATPPAEVSALSGAAPTGSLYGAPAAGASLADAPASSPAVSSVSSVPSGSALDPAAVSSVASAGSGAGVALDGAGPGDDPTTVLAPAGTTGTGEAGPSTATDGASVGVPSGPNPPAEAAGLPSSGVVPTTTLAPDTGPSEQPASSPVSSAAVDAVPSAAAQVSTPPGVAVEDQLRAATPATSAAMPVSSAPMHQVTAPVSAAPAGVTAMPAAGSDLVAPPPVELADPADYVSAPPGEYAVAEAPVSGAPLSTSVPGGSVSAPPLGLDAAPGALTDEPLAAPGAAAPAGESGGALAGDGDGDEDGADGRDGNRPGAGGSGEAA
ncbi:cobyrinate a,c-diamide synthase [Dactylosporangium sp. NPDC005572]|uniref:cobyrinate a,c-diamide synthase n=1 Tax=Dactylosporangium sp. NPDC005572 TaxID=3156889 RepID=UPI00339FA6A7